MNDDITLRLSSKKLDIIANALGMRPYVEVAELLQDISQQIRSQQQPQNLEPGGDQASDSAASTMQ